MDGVIMISSVIYTIPTYIQIFTYIIYTNIYMYVILLRSCNAYSEMDISRRQREARKKEIQDKVGFNLKTNPYCRL